jgi:hypothetical protein
MRRTTKLISPLFARCALTAGAAGLYFAG